MDSIDSYFSLCRPLKSGLEIPWQVYLLVIGFISIFGQIFWAIRYREEINDQHKKLESWIKNACKNAVSRVIWGNDSNLTKDQRRDSFSRFFFLRVGSIIWSLCSSEVLEICSELLDMTYRWNQIDLIITF